MLCKHSLGFVPWYAMATLAVGVCEPCLAYRMVALLHQRSDFKKREKELRQSDVQTLVELLKC